MTRDEQRAIEWECERLALRFAQLNDAQDYRALVELFMPDGVFARPTDPDNPLQGREAILASLEARPKDRITRHLCSNIVIDALAPDRAKGAICVLLYSGRADATSERFGLRADPQQLVGEFRDDYLLTGAGWRIARRLGKVVFTAG